MTLLIIYLLGTFLFLFPLKPKYFYVAFIWPLFLLIEILLIPVRLERMRKERERRDAIAKEIHMHLSKAFRELEEEIEKRSQQDGASNGVCDSVDTGCVDSDTGNKEGQK